MSGIMIFFTYRLTATFQRLAGAEVRFRYGLRRDIKPQLPVDPTLLIGIMGIIIREAFADKEW